MAGTTSCASFAQSSVCRPTASSSGNRCRSRVATRTIACSSLPDRVADITSSTKKAGPAAAPLATVALLQPEAAQASLAQPQFDLALDNPLGGINPFETALVLAPISLYSVFWVYRSKVNPKAKLADFILILAATAIIANILSIIFLKKRYF